MRVLYLASGRARLKHKDVVYNDLFEPGVDLQCDMLDVDLSDYDFLIATPPCNYYSRANHNRNSSYSQSTKHLLPTIIDKFILSGKPFVVENVRSAPLFSSAGLFNKSCFVYFHGRHTYWTNIMINFSFIPQEFDFCHANGHCKRLKSYVQGGDNVNRVFDFFIEYLEDKK